MDSLFDEIPYSKNWVDVQKITYGWSDDLKFYIEDSVGRRYMLRINRIDKYSCKKREFEMLQKFNQLPYQMSKAISFGVCNNNQNVYMLLSWVEGASLEYKIESLPLMEQYQLGLQAGEILKAIHSIPVEECDRPKETKINRKLKQLSKYEQSKYRIPKDEPIIQYIKKNIYRICKTPPVYQQGDFHLGNMIYTNDHQVGLIDFNRWECGDRFEDFYKMESFDVKKSKAFAAGQLHGYFNGEPPLWFWRVLSVYVAHASLYSIVWATKFEQKDIDNMTAICMSTLEHYQYFTRIIPTWYEEFRDFKGNEKENKKLLL
ncbi:MAG: phosphotransferase [bacterium]|nr:phosphotransferase [bacterium]